MRKHLIATFLFLLSIHGGISAQPHEPDIRWQTLETPHFRIHFPAGFDSLARRVAMLCEEAYEPVSRSLNYFPGKTHVVLHTRSDFPNGFAGFMPWRMELLIAEPQEDWFGSRDDWLRILIVHEFTHVVQLRKHRGLSTWTYPLLGQFNALWQSVAPRWYIEGFATRNETFFTRGGRGRNPFHEMQMLAPARSGLSWRLENTAYISRKKQPPGMFYIAGYYFTDYLNRTFGDSTWAAILDTYSKWPIFGFYHAIKKVTGKSAGQLYAAMLDSLKALQKTVPDFRPAEMHLLAAPGKLPEDYLAPRWLDPNTLIAYHTGFDILPELVRVDVQGRKKRLLQRRLVQLNNSFTVKGNRLIWSENRPHPRFTATEPHELMMYNLDTGTLQKLTSRQRLVSPDFHPHQNRLVAVQNDVPGNRLVLFDLDSREISVLLELPGKVFLTPRWSRSGRLIAFALKDAASGRQDIAVMDVASRTWRYVYEPDRFHDTQPCWSADDRLLFYTSDRSGVFNIWAVNIETGQQWMVTNDSLGVIAPDVSPEGSLLAFSKYTPAGFALAVMPVNVDQFLPADFLPADSHNSIEPESRPQSSAPTPLLRLRAYQPWKDILLPQAWFPFAIQGEGGTTPAVFLMSQDALRRHSWGGYFGFSPSTRLASWDMFYVYNRWWPQITFSHAYLPQKVVFQQYSGWWRRTRAELSVQLPLLLERNVYTSFLQPYVTYRFENRQHSRGPIFPINSRYRGIRVGVQWLRYTRTLRDVVPHRAFSIHLFGEWSLPVFGNQFSAHQFATILNSYLPMPLRHHQLQTLVVYQNRQGNYPYSRLATAPVGYQSGKRQQLRLRLTYHFPVAYLEWALPFFRIYLDYLAGGLFFDWGTSWNRGAGSQRWLAADRFSTGIQLGLRGSTYQIFSGTLGLRLYYRSAFADWKYGFFIDIDL